MERYFEQFLLYLNLQKGYSYHTIRAYQLDLEQFIAYCSTQNVSNPASIDAKLVKRFIYFIQDNNVSARSVARKISSIKSWWKYLSKQQLVSEDIFNI